MKHHTSRRAHRRRSQLRFDDDVAVALSNNVTNPSASPSFTAGVVQLDPLDGRVALQADVISPLPADHDPQYFVASSTLLSNFEASQLPFPSLLRPTPVANSSYPLAQGPIYGQNRSSEFASPNEVSALASVGVPRSSVSVGGRSSRLAFLLSTNREELFPSIW